MAPESRVVSVLGLRVGDEGGGEEEALLDALHLLQSVPAAVLQTEFDRSRSSDRNPKFHKLTSFTNKAGVVAVSTTRTSHRVKDSIQLRDSINTLSLWIRSSLTEGIRDFPL
ncbi:unnamed protein product [Sphagnum balticum]